MWSTYINVSKFCSTKSADLVLFARCAAFYSNFSVNVAQAAKAVTTDTKLGQNLSSNVTKRTLQTRDQGTCHQFYMAVENLYLTNREAVHAVECGRSNACAH